MLRSYAMAMLLKELLLQYSWALLTIVTVISMTLLRCIQEELASVQFSNLKQVALPTTVKEYLSL